MSTLPRVVADFETQLATALSIGGTGFTLASFLDDDGVALPDGLYCFTVDNGSSVKEYLMGSMASGVVTSVQSVSRQAALTSGAMRPHRVGASVILTDFVSIKYLADFLSGNAALDGTHPLIYDTEPTFLNNLELVTKQYADGIASAGAPDASTTTKGIAKLSVAPVSPTSPIAVGDNDPRLPTTTEIAAMAAASSPSGTNPFQTEADTQIDVQTFAAGTSTWTRPANAKVVQVILIGGGCGGQGGQNNTSAGNGGGNGAFLSAVVPASLLASTEAVVVGAGSAGTAGGGSPAGPSAGGNTSFGALFTAGGGSLNTGGIGMVGGLVAPAGGTSTSSGSPGRNSVFNANLAGGAAGTYPGGNGGNGGASAAGIPTVGATGGSGASNSGQGGNGGNGGLYGAGGGGGGNGGASSGSAGNGGNGADGIAVIITYF